MTRRIPRTASSTRSAAVSTVEPIGVDDEFGSGAVQRLALGEQAVHRRHRIAVEQRAVLAARRPLGEHRRVGAAATRRRRPIAPAASRFSSCSSTPPAAAMTSGSGDARASRRAAVSSFRNAPSPSASQISRTVRPVRASISSSESTSGRPSRAASAPPHRGLAGAHHPDEHEMVHRRAHGEQRRPERGGVADELGDRVAAELALRLSGQHEGDHRLGDHAHRRHRGDVGALLERHRRLLGGGVDGLQHRHVERGQRLHRRPQRRSAHPSTSHPRCRRRGWCHGDTGRQSRPSGWRRGPRSPAGRRRRTRRRARPPSQPGCSSRPGPGGRRACGPSGRGCRARPARRRPAPRRRRPANRRPLPPP